MSPDRHVLGNIPPTCIQVSMILNHFARIVPGLSCFREYSWECHVCIQVSSILIISAGIVPRLSYFRDYSYKHHVCIQVSRIRIIWRNCTGTVMFQGIFLGSSCLREQSREPVEPLPSVLVVNPHQSLLH